MNLLLLLFLFFSIASSTFLPPDLRALISLKSSLQIHGWEIESDPVWCSWNGVQCRGGQQQLPGALPREFMFLRFLEQMNLGGSYFEGEIPIGYGSFSRLKFLHLGGNAFDGPLPPQLGFLTQLERKEIGYNSWSGRVPVDISTCFLPGNLTEELGNLTQLQPLLLFKNQFTGEIPQSFAKLKSIRVLDLS
ncbi:Leucine-rich repeat receptor-like protein kinase TDR [Linum perenne]